MNKIEPKEFHLKNGRKCIIRTAEETDAEQLMEQILSVLAEGKYLVTTLDDKEDFTIEKIKDRIKNSLENQFTLRIVVEIDNHIVASAALNSLKLKRMQHVVSAVLSVLKDYRGLGIGNAIMETLIQWATSHSYIEKIGLGVFDNNQRAINLYKKFGFLEEGRKIKELKIGPDNYVDNILMYKFVK
jgi:ribosomal protein S18 acetylase RimI-like enzyme